MKPKDSDIKKTSGLFLVPRAPNPPKMKVETRQSGGHLVVRGEFSDRMEAITRDFVEEHQPCGPTETILVREMAGAFCRTEHAVRLQAQGGMAANPKTLDALMLYQSTNEKSFRRALKMLQMVQKERKREEASKPRLVKPKTTGGC